MSAPFLAAARRQHALDHDPCARAAKAAMDAAWRAYEATLDSPPEHPRRVAALREWGAAERAYSALMRAAERGEL